MKVMNGLDLQNQKIINLGDPSANTDAANKQYVDSVARGLSIKMPVRAASTANVTIATPGTTLDGVTLAASNRILLKDQTVPTENGIYVWTSSGSALTRATDADTGAELQPGFAVSVTEGTVNAETMYVISSDAAITVGSTAIQWALVKGGNVYTASNGVVLTGSNFTGVAAPAGGLTVGASGFSVDTSIVSRKASGNLGNGALTTIAVTHSLGTKDVIVNLRETATDEMVSPHWVATDINTVTFTFPTAPSAAQYRWSIQG